jgi:hypothetical protein
MPQDVTGPTARGVAGLQMEERVVQALREQLPVVATQTVAAVVREVPGYTGALSASMSDNIEAAVTMALGGFLKLASRSRGSDPGTPLGPTLEGAYALGRGEARSGRSMDALLAAYRVGARVAWRELSRAAAEADVGADTMAQFAELVFAYIDELSAASVAGHGDELSTTGRVQERYLERLGQQLLTGASPDIVAAGAERAGWPVPRTLTAVLLPAAQVRGIVATLGQGTLRVGEDLPGLPDLGDGSERVDQTSLLLVPDMEGRDRQRLLRILQGRSAVVGPARPWSQARASYLRAVRTLVLVGPGTDRTDPVDSERHLAELVVGADADALDDLCAQVLAPLTELRPAAADRLAETLRSWLLHQGRRDAVAEDLHVHAQTVRYRMGQLRELYGDRLDDPRTVLELVLALHRPGRGPAEQPGGGSGVSSQPAGATT